MGHRLRLGVVGYSSQKFDEEEARKILRREIGSRAASRDVTVISGLTDLGIPKIAYEVATELNLRTGGIACAKAREYECWPCDQVLIIGDDWGEESDAFLAVIDELIKVGGGQQSRREFDSFGGPKTDFPLPTIE